MLNLDILHIFIIYTPIFYFIQILSTFIQILYKTCMFPTHYFKQNLAGVSIYFIGAKLLYKIILIYILMHNHRILV